MKALKSDLARSLVSVDWNTMTAKASDGTEYRMSAVSSTPTPGAVGKAGQKDCYCGGWEDETGAYHQQGCPEMSAPSHPLEAKAGDSFYTFEKPEGWINLANPGQSWEDWTREQGPPTTKGWKVGGAKAGEDA